jgi:NAD(P)-dependent dehydrogenase (short-subunit alcohol dehydrogenase family)
VGDDESSIGAEPGRTETPLLREALKEFARQAYVRYEELVARRTSRTTVGRLAEAGAIAGAAPWLAPLAAPDLIAGATGREVMR